VRDEELLHQLQALTDQLGIELLEKEGDFTGGIYRLRDHTVFLINSSLSVSQAVRIFCRELARQDLSKVYILPAIRELIDSQRGPGPRSGL
jgi:hypothetical protein